MKKILTILALLAICMLTVAAQGRIDNTPSYTIDSADVILNRGPIWRPSSPVFEEIGASGIYQSLSRIGKYASFASIGAHPDDDDSGMFAYLTKAEQVRVANVIANRGEGGQNAIGPELYQGLGVIRTGELLAARNIDGAEQYFLSAYDFGFSRSGDEALTFWNQENLIGDIVRFIRTFRPQVVLNHHGNEYVTVTGHGQHQGMGKIVPMAVAAAADPNAYPEQIKEGLLPWTVSRVFTRGEGNTIIDRGTFDPVIGRSYQQIGTEGRSYHRTQSMGNIQALGSSTANFKLQESVSPFTEDPKTFFDGIDTTLTGIADLTGDEEGKIPFLRVGLEKLNLESERILDSYNPKYPELIVADLDLMLSQFKTLHRQIWESKLSTVKKDYVMQALERKINETEQAMIKTSGVILEAFSAKSLYTAGDNVEVNFTVYAVGKTPVTVKKLAVHADKGDTVEKQVDAVIQNNAVIKESVKLTVDDRTPVSRIFWSTDGKVLTLEDSDPAMIIQPFRDYPLVGYAQVQIGSAIISLKQPVQNRIQNVVIGEERTYAAVVAPFSVAVNPKNIIVKASPSEQTIDLQISVTANKAAEVQLEVDTVAGIHIVLEQETLSFTTAQTSQIVNAKLVIPGNFKQGKYPVSVSITAEGEKYTDGYAAIHYPHVEKHYLYSSATSNLSIIDVDMAKDVRIGYVQYNDTIPEYLEQVGIKIDILSPEFMEMGNFDDYDTIVIGPLAYEFRSDLVNNNARLLDWVSRGGVLMVQYTRVKWNSLNVGPYPSTIGSLNRVTVEEAEITVLQPEHPIFNYPNKITTSDFEGWIQERGLYFFESWDEHYLPLLACQDPGFPLQKGGLMVAELGKGLWIYNAYAFFRQIPGAVPGGYRIFANILSLPASLK
ncbi:PIG-L family deacetylase [Parasphaerochaeta coccoides]|uniref:LmbE family protein n=1 Tax=Parasphaerochaeta coccoides (strain ATCC BAA-1237 / DSM 17374 / SPN1) TaxID=760011 RepID=F4GIT6_PARC1|nr:PIG-L family deacetylase [Parasphaerochaeta coccoides]AEC02704.1 LmbE family protein [Parasphaerochaeta coccoides DSM 17374]